jgi:DNA integrity scanning protein DisA with diadenylate cyclase activity
MDEVILFVLPGCEECAQMKFELEEILSDFDDPPEVIIHDYEDDEAIFTDLCLEYGIDDPPACVVAGQIFQDELDPDKIKELLGG